MKKVAFSTISTTVGDDNLSFTATNASKNDLLNKKKTKQSNDEEHALRFEINLNLSDESNDNCAEFSFKDLVKDAESKSNLPDDPDSIYERQEEEKMKEIAKNFEAKYGTSTKKKKFKNTYEDYIDKGLGYDETDSFIDNGEAYDELLPSTITTKYGGFYINFGKLEFRACSDEEENLIADDDDLEDEDSREFRNSKKRKNRSSDFNEKVKRKKRVIESDEDNQNDNSRDLESDEDDEEDSESLSSSSNSQQQNQQIIKKKKLQQNNKQQNPNQTISNIIDSVVKKSTNNSKNGSQSTPNSSIKLNSQINNINKDDPFSIPDELNSNVKEKLQQLKDMKLNQPDNKKPRNYSDDIYKIIFDIDSLVQNSSSSTRNQVQSWLTNYLAISKDTLTKRIKKMKISNEETKLKQNVSKLRMEVSYLIEEYEEAYEEKLSKWEKDKQNGLDSQSPEGGLDKEFKFNDKIRDLLRKILSSKRLLVDLAGIKGKQEEDNITNYFNNEIKNIWPSNWITNSNLLKNAGFISKYNNQTSVDKSSISVIKKTPPRPTNLNNNQPLNLNVPKSSSQQNNVNKEKVKQQNHPKDLSIEKSTNKNDKFVNSSNNSQQQQQQQQQQLQIKSSAESLLAKKQNEQTHQKSSLLNNPQQLNSLDNFHQQYSLNSLTKNASNLMKSANIEQMQHKIGQQLKDHNNSINKNIKQQQAAHQQLLQQQQNKFQQQSPKSSQSLDKPQNLSNYVSFTKNNSHNSSTQNLAKKQSSSSQLNDLQRQQSSTSNHSLSKNNQYQQQPQQQQQFQIPANNKLPSSSPNSLSTKQSINKSLEVDYKFDKAILNQFHRSTSLPNNNNFNQPQSKSITPKPAHSNNNPSNPLITNPQLYLNAQQQQQLLQNQLHQLAMQRLVNQPYFNEAILKYQQSSGMNAIAGQDKKSTDLNTSTNSLNNYNFVKKFNTGNNQQLTNQSQYLGTSTTVSSASVQSKNDDNLINSNNSQLNNTNYNTQIQKQNDFDINSLINSSNNDKQNKLNNSNQYFNTNSSISNRYSSPNQLNQSNSTTIATDLTKQSLNYQTNSDLVGKQTNYQNTSDLVSKQTNYQNTPDLVSKQTNYQNTSDLVSKQTNSIYTNYSEYMNLNNQMQQQQQQLYQLNIQQQRQDDSSKRLERK